VKHAYVLAIVLALLQFSNATEPARIIEFDSEIMPILSKHGCNAGACHGAASGRGHFRLSLFGSDAQSDYLAIVSAFEGRRIHRLRPETSLLLLKPTAELPHGGDQALEPDSKDAATIHAWIAQGAHRGKARRVVQFRVSPAERMLSGLDSATQLTAFATFDGLDERDVTPWTTFESNDSSAMTWSEGKSTTTVHRPGIYFLQARFLDQVAIARFTVPYPSEDTTIAQTTSAFSNFIDEEIADVHRQLGKLPLEAARDYEFVRRVSLDLIGRLPTPEMIREFRVDSAAGRHQRLIERLLESSEFVDYWTLFLSKWWNVKSFPQEPESAECYSFWIKKTLEQRTGYDAMVRQLLTAEGDTHVVGPANFSRSFIDPRAQAEAVGSWFMGTRIKCANCHNHPLDRWTQDDYHGLAAIFSKLDRKRIVSWGGSGTVTNPRTGEDAVPRLPADRDLEISHGAQHQFADWLTAQDNPYFAKSIVNRLWYRMMGRGLVEPVDDFRASNPVSHPKLLDRLASEFCSSGFQLRYTLKQIATSEAYQRRAYNGPRESVPLYLGVYSKPLEAEVLLDAIQDALEIRDRTPIAGQKRAIDAVDQSAEIEDLDILGACRRATGQTCVGMESAGIETKHALQLIQGSVLNSRIANQSNLIHRMRADNQPWTNILAQLTLRAFGRDPNDVENQSLHKRLEGHANAIEEIEDLAWSIFCSDAFRNNF
jgi:Protein of unknown function (DUF1549)/Protein of unknown function (DUF1553)